MNIQNFRTKYEMAVETMNRLAPKGMASGDITINRSKLRLTQDLSSTISGSIIFDISGSGTIFTNPVISNRNQIQLVQSDAFFVTGIGLVLAAYTTANGIDEKIWYTYPNNVVFGTNYIQLFNIYQSTIDIVKSNSNVMTAIDCNQFLKIPELQKGLAVSANATVNILINDPKYLNDVIVDLEPNLLLNGSDNNQIRLNLPSGTSYDMSTASQTNQIDIYLDGFLIKNGGANMLK